MKEERDLKDHLRMREKILRIEGIGRKTDRISVREWSNKPEWWG